jgi:hypothetical protein
MFLAKAAARLVGFVGSAMLCSSNAMLRASAFALFYVDKCFGMSLLDRFVCCCACANGKSFKTVCLSAMLSSAMAASVASERVASMPCLAKSRLWARQAWSAARKICNRTIPCQAGGKPCDEVDLQFCVLGRQAGQLRAAVRMGFGVGSGMLHETTVWWALCKEAVRLGSSQQ